MGIGTGTTTVPVVQSLKSLLTRLKSDHLRAQIDLDGHRRIESDENSDGELDILPDELEEWNRATQTFEQI